MINFIYDIHTMTYQQNKFRLKCTAIEYHSNILQYVPTPRKLALSHQQRKSWIPIDPIRKKMIELSQNGKLFRVPLYGPPLLPSKTKFQLEQKLRQLPRPLPPRLPTVGISGLAIYIKKPPVLPYRIVPSYISRIKSNKQVTTGNDLVRLRPTQQIRSTLLTTQQTQDVEYDNVHGLVVPSERGKQRVRKKKRKVDERRYI